MFVMPLVDDAAPRVFSGFNEVPGGPAPWTGVVVRL
jgi:hypothetical protein